MNAWDIFVHIATWLGLMVLLVLLFFIAWLVLNAIWHEVAKMLRKGKDDFDRYLLEARTLVPSLDNDATFRTGFMAGVRWAWGYFHRAKYTKK